MCLVGIERTLARTDCVATWLCESESFHLSVSEAFQVDPVQVQTGPSEPVSASGSALQCVSLRGICHFRPPCFSFLSFLSLGVNVPSVDLFRLSTFSLCNEISIMLNPKRILHGKKYLALSARQQAIPLVTEMEVREELLRVSWSGITPYSLAARNFECPDLRDLVPLISHG
jgi:hypothetical protein